MQSGIQFKGITKRFGELTANSDVNLTIQKNSIHGVVGENGAGKSTLLKILYGLYQPDAGEILIDDKVTPIPNPQAAIRLGIGMVHQHFQLVPTLSGWQNIILGDEPSLGFLNAKQIQERLDVLQTAFGFKIDLGRKTGELPVGHQQQIEILKLLYRNADVLIFDEPTAVLAPQEIEALLARLRTLHYQGKTIILVSHKLKEVLSITQHVTIMRQGRVVETVATSSLTETSLAERMIGRRLVPLPQRSSKPPGNTVLEAKAIEASGIHQITLALREGEIVGLAGIEGNGQRELIEILSGVNRRYSGDLTFEGASTETVSSYLLHQQGLNVMPPDRHHEALILDFSVKENLILGHHRESPLTRGGLFNQDIWDEQTKSLIRDFDIRPDQPEALARALSGGNQQKIVIGRETAGRRAGKVRCLIAAHPTRGVDIGAIEFIHSLFVRLRDEGAAVFLISSEIDELLALSDRILVIGEGRIRGEVSRAEATESQLGLWMTGGGG